LPVAGGLAKWLEDKGMEHVRGAPYHPQTQGKSSAGTRPSRTAFYLRTTICPAIWDVVVLDDDRIALAGQDVGDLPRDGRH
jgi:hypothetical protein